MHNAVRVPVTSPGLIMPLALLAVFSEPGSLVTLDEFQDWYNNEHVPLRLNHLPSFLTGARYISADSLKPSWLAIYDIDDISTFEHPSYTRLRLTRSPREADVIGRLDILDRRTYQVLYDSGESSLTNSFKFDNPTSTLITHGIVPFPEVSREDQKDSDVITWCEKAVGSLKSAEGWIRTRCFLCIDSLKVGVSVSDGPDAQVVPRYLLVHELVDTTAADSSAFRSAILDTTLSVEVVELRKWGLYRAYPCVAQGNLSANSGY